MMQIVTHTPGWVFGLLLALVILGLQQTRDRQVKQWLAYLLPAGMVVLSCVGVISTFGAEVLSLSLWILGLGLMASVCYILFPLKNMRYFSGSNRFYIPGSWIPLFVILAIFFTKYPVAVLYALNNPVTAQVLFMPTLCVVYGGFSGYFISRALYLFRTAHSERNLLSVN